MDKIRKAVRTNKIDLILSEAKNIKREHLEEAVELYEKFYQKEFDVTRSIQNIMAKLRVNKFKYSIPNFGNYTYKID
jgi:transcription initiation factor TFIIIB Brf1 subunit/transcription initiation factor TFIIB